MKAKHKRLVGKAEVLKTSISEKEKTLATAAAKHESAQKALDEARSKLSECEAEAANAGLSVAELHAGLD